MRKWLQNYVLFILLLAAMLCQVVSGFVLWLALESGDGYQGGRGDITDDTFMSWTRNQWVDFHDWTAVAFIVLVVLHLILHWKWITYTTKKAFSFRQ